MYQRNPSIQAVAELEDALHQEWALVPQEIILRLMRSMMRRIQAVISAHGSYTRCRLVGGARTSS